MTDITVAKGHVVSFHYTLTVDDQIVDKSDAERGPLAYLHGYGNIVPGLERELEGAPVGTKKQVTVPPELGYGTRDDDAYEKVPSSEFEGMQLQKGMPIQAQLPDGRTVVYWVDAVAEDHVVLTLNHPLSGRTLNFDVELVGIRESSDEEKAHGHPHGPGGHQH